MLNKHSNRIQICVFLCCYSFAVVNSLKINSEAELGSGDFDSVELVQRQNIDLQAIPKSEVHQLNELRKSLRNDINDFIDLIPADEVAAKIVEYYRNDIDVHNVINFVNSFQFQLLRQDIVDSQEFCEFDVFLNNLGFNVETVCRRLNNLLGFTKLNASGHYQSSNKPTITPVHTTIGGLHGLIEDVLAMLPQDGIFIMFFDKLESSPGFSNIVEQISSPEFLRKFNRLRNSELIRDAVERLSQQNVNVNKILEQLSSYFLFGTF